MKRGCEWCSALFAPSGPGHVCCSARCRNARKAKRFRQGHRAGRRVVQCRECGVAFVPAPCVAHKAAFCSRRCKNRAVGRRHHTPAPHPERACVECGAAFRAKLAGHRFCSPRCRLTATRRAYLARRPARAARMRRAAYRKRRRADPQKYNAKARAWRAANPEKSRAAAKAYQARRRAEDRALRELAALAALQALGGAGP